MEGQMSSERKAPPDPPPWIDGAEFPALSEDSISRLCAAVANHGYCRLDNAVSPAQVTQALDRARAAVQSNGGEYLSLTGLAAIAPQDGYLLSGIHDGPLLAMAAALYALWLGKPAIEGAIHQVLRCVKGVTGQSHARYVHFDSYVVTILIPLTASPAAGGGDLILLCKRRTIPRSYLVNVLMKFFLDLAPAQALLWRGVASGRLAATRLKLIPGAAYVFSGCRTLHTNDRSVPGELRATLLYHYGNPHHRARSRVWFSRLRGCFSRSGGG